MVLKFAIFLTFLTLLSGSTPLSNSLKSRQLGYAYVTKEGNVTLQKGYSNFYVNVDFANHYSDASDSETYDPSTESVLLALYTSQTVLTQDCSGFNEYECSDYTCTADTSSTASVDLPYFNVEGYYATADVYLDYSNWQLNDQAVIATSCSGNSDPSSYTYGIVGLGINPDYSSNFIGDTNTFSIWLSQDLTTGTLLFSENTDITSSASLTGSLSTDNEWNIAPSFVTIGCSSNSVSGYAGAIFDINSDAMGFPSSIYTNLISTLSYTASLSCSGVTYKPLCSYSGSISDLPILQLTINDVQIPLPPNIYMEDYNIYSDESDFNGQFTLNFKSLDEDLSDQSYVTSTYENYIIFDQNFMSYYYTTFSFSSGVYTVSLYNQYGLPNTSSTTLVWPFVVVGILVLIVVITLICWCVQKKNTRRARRQAAARTTDPAINNSEISQATPLVQEYTIPYHPQNYPPSNYGYNQGNYGYPQYPPQPSPYGNNNFNNVPQSNYPYLPPAQGQFNGNTGGYGYPAQGDNRQF